MTNTTIVFYPTRQPISPTPDPEVGYVINLTLTQFERSSDDNIKQSTTLGGILTSTLFNEAYTYGCAAEPFTATAEEMTMFFASVKNAESFTMTNLDENDRVMSVQMIGAGGRSRQTSADINEFEYSFTVREQV